ncbi:MAG: hypothetical protein M3O71_17015 [Bacteroidota bacterium]|nr:hypothetical protein [Bacteroidota bacterium]
MLYEELKNLNPQIEIKCFKGLADALREFNKTEEIKTLPKENDLLKISKDESSLNTRVFLTGAAIEFEPDTPIICSLCLQENNFSRMHFIDRLTGVSELRFVCNNCGSIYTR